MNLCIKEIPVHLLDFIYTINTYFLQKSSFLSIIFKFRKFSCLLNFISFPEIEILRNTEYCNLFSGDQFPHKSEKNHSAYMYHIKYW